jgi:hypothetical protein
MPQNPVPEDSIVPHYATPSNPRKRPLIRSLRIMFGVAGSFAALLGIAVIALALVFHPLGAIARAISGSLLYFGIGAACFYIAARAKPS